MRLVVCGASGVWDELVAADSRATPFHDWSFLRDIAARSGWRFRPLLAVADGHPVGVVPVLSLRRIPMTPPLPFPYLGPLVPSQHLRGTLSVLRRWQVRHAHLLFRAAFSPQQPPPPAESDPGLEVDVEPTYVLDLSHGDESTYLSGLHSDRRAALRRAARSGITTRPSLPGEALAVLPQVMQRSFERHDAEAPRSVTAIAEYLDERMGSDGRLIVETVLEHEQPVGLLVGVRHGDRAYGWVGGTLPESLRTGASTAAYDAVIRRALHDGVLSFDFYGHVDAGVGRFKASFGAEQQPFWTLRSSLVPRRLAVLRRRSTWRRPGGRVQ
ncbi:hypothetical protein GCM10025783_27920 [Amnibacterium soli]|uniref:BioF2-like acetyltransferase domain-containing protein n=1 Tax=Amnibacterium soli TaxID=1282736 RepID=A0ABP8ZDP7_9MICO